MKVLIVNPKYTEFKLIYLRGDFSIVALFLRFNPSTWGSQISPHLLHMSRQIQQACLGKTLGFLQVWQLLSRESSGKAALQSTKRCVN